MRSGSVVTPLVRVFSGVWLAEFSQKLFVVSSFLFLPVFCFVFCFVFEYRCTLIFFVQICYEVRQRLLSLIPNLGNAVFYCRFSLRWF